MHIHNQIISDLSEQDQVGSYLSLFLNWLLRIALIPLVLFSIMSIIPTIMMSDGGTNLLVETLMFLTFGVCWLLPVSVFFIIGISEKYRKNGRVLLSIAIQLFTLLITSIPFLWLFIF